MSALRYRAHLRALFVLEIASAFRVCPWRVRACARKPWIEASSHLPWIGCLLSLLPQVPCTIVETMLFVSFLPTQLLLRPTWYEVMGVAL